jgi:hypothetical protein
MHMHMHYMHYALHVCIYLCIQAITEIAIWSGGEHQNHPLNKICPIIRKTILTNIKKMKIRLGGPAKLRDVCVHA